MNKTMLMITNALLFCGILLCTTGCEDQPTVKGTQSLNEKSEKAQTMLENMDPITSAVVLTNDDEIYAAADVKHMARFRLEAIRKDSHSLLSKNWPDDSIHFSTDKKAVTELKKLNHELASKSIKKEERTKRLHKIEEYMKG